MIERAISETGGRIDVFLNNAEIADAHGVEDKGNDLRRSAGGLARYPS